MDASIRALEIAKVATAEIPVPGLSTALTVALSLAKRTKDIKDTQDDCRALAERAAGFALAVCQQLKGSSGDTGLQDHVMKFLFDLQDIENLMNRRLRAGKRERILFAFKHGKFAKEVKSLSTRLDDSYRAFMIQAALGNDHNVHTIMSGHVRVMQHVDNTARVGQAVLSDTRVIRTKLSDLAQRVGSSSTFDGNFRLFARENLQFLEPIVEWDEPPHSLAEPKGKCTVVRVPDWQHRGCVFRYRALLRAAGDLSGTQVMVDTYTQHDSRRFAEAVDFAKRTCHPYIMSVLGYSRPSNPGEASYIVMEDYSPIAEFVNSHHGISKIRAMLQILLQLFMAVEHLENVELDQVLPVREFLGVRLGEYELSWHELVYDHRGSCVKLARGPLALETPGKYRCTVVAISRATRFILSKAIRLMLYSSAEIVASLWFSLYLVSYDTTTLPDRTRWDWWEPVVRCPRYPAGTWLGRNHLSHLLGVQPAPIEALAKGYLKRAVLPSVVPGLGGLPPDAPFEPPQRPYLANHNSRSQKLNAIRNGELPEFDRAEMDIKVKLTADGTTWRRYRFSCIHAGETKCFRQVIRWPNPADVLATVRAVALAELSSLGLDHAGSGLGAGYTYFTQTTVAIAPHAAERIPPPLWFFLHSPADEDQSFANRPDIPWGFWSLEKTPAAIPTSIMFDPTPQVERIRENVEAPLSIWTQVLGDLTFTIRTKMCASIVKLSEDELLVLKEIQESRRAVGGSDVNRSGESGTTSPWDDSHKDNEAGTYDSDGSDPHDGDSDEDTDVDDTNNAVCEAASLEPINRDHYDQTYLESADSAYVTSDSASEYHDAEEYHSVAEEAIGYSALSL